MKCFNTFVLCSSDYKKAIGKMLNSITWKSHQLEFLANAETASMRFFRTLLMEESGQSLSSAEQASHEGEKILLLLDRLYALMDDNYENHHLVTLLAVSTGVWIADRKGEIRELDLIVSGIAAFANQSTCRHDLEELYEVSLRILCAADDYLQADLNKQDERRPWRYLCLNHCIIATRTGNGDLAKSAYDRLIKYLPEEAEPFFSLGMRKVNAGQYSPHCRKVMEVYYKMYCSDHHSPNEMNMSLN